jgi:hypothetical protein
MIGKHSCNFYIKLNLGNFGNFYFSTVYVLCFLNFWILLGAYGGFSLKGKLGNKCELARNKNGYRVP